MKYYCVTENLILIPILYQRFLIFFQLPYLLSCLAEHQICHPQVSGLWFFRNRLPRVTAPDQSANRIFIALIIRILIFCAADGFAYQVVFLSSCFFILHDLFLSVVLLRVLRVFLLIFLLVFLLLLFLRLFFLVFLPPDFKPRKS